MIQKTPVFYPLISHRVFFVNQSVIYDYSINSRFSLIICLYDLYAKLNFTASRQLNQFCLKSYSINWKRVVFKGKGFRLRKFAKTTKLTLNFGHSHWTRIGFKSEQLWFKKLKRQNYLLFSTNFFCLKTLSNYIKSIKKLNVYTKRGLRLKKQFIRRRFGKISQVVSSLH